MTSYSIGQVASLSGVTVRTLRHYDTIGLLGPSSRSDNGYRAYDNEDLERLRTILVYRELDMPLADIARVLDESGNTTELLLEERHRVAERISRLRAISDSIDKMIETHRKGIAMSPTESLEVFRDFDPEEHEQEAEERWGSSEEFAQSVRRTSSYTKRDWEQSKSEAAAIDQRFLALMASDVAPDDPKAAAVVDAHRNHISKWFYECSAEVHAGLGEMYVTDERFKSNIDKDGDGLAAYMSAAIAARYAG